MEFNIRQKIGITITFLGCILLLGFNWTGSIAVIIGIVSCFIGLYLTITEKSNINNIVNRWFDTSNHDGE